MRIVAALSLALLTSFGLFAQKGNYINPAPVVTSGFGGAARTTSPFVPTLNGSVSFVSPLGGAARATTPIRRVPRTNPVVAPAGVYSYPLFFGGYGSGYPGYGYAGDVPVDGSQQQPPNITVIYPPQPAPVIISPYAPGDGTQPVRPRMYDLPAPSQDDTATAPEAPHFLIAFKDHTIYSASNYWVDGDTLHYFTSGNTHNQVSLSLVDRDLTLRLNKESGNDMKLPEPKQ